MKCPLSYTTQIGSGSSTEKRRQTRMRALLAGNGAKAFLAARARSKAVRLFPRKSWLKCRKRATFPRKHKSRTHGKSEEIKSAGRQAGRQGRAGQAGAGRGRGRAGRHRGRQAGITPFRTFSWQSPLFAPFRGKSRNSPLGRQLAPQVAPRTTSRHPDDKPPLG